MCVCDWEYVSVCACAEVAGFGRVMDCLFYATHFLINPQSQPGGGERARERNKEKLSDKGRRE